MRRMILQSCVTPSAPICLFRGPITVEEQKIRNISVAACDGYTFIAEHWDASHDDNPRQHPFEHRNIFRGQQLGAGSHSVVTQFPA